MSKIEKLTEPKGHSEETRRKIQAAVKKTLAERRASVPRKDTK